MRYVGALVIAFNLENSFLLIKMEHVNEQKRAYAEHVRRSSSASYLAGKKMVSEANIVHVPVFQQEGSQEEKA